MNKDSHPLLPKYKLVHVISEELISCDNVSITELSITNPTAYYQLFNLWLKSSKNTAFQKRCSAETFVNEVVQSIPNKLLYREVLLTTEQQSVSDILILRIDKQLHLVFLQLLPTTSFSKNSRDISSDPPGVIKIVQFEAILFELIGNLIALAKLQNCQQITTKLYNPILIKMFIKAGFLLTENNSVSDIIENTSLTFFL